MRWSFATFFNQMKREVDASLGEIETLLALGATARQAVQEPLKRRRYCES